LHALGQVGLYAAFGIDLGQAVRHRPPECALGEGGGIGSRVERIGRRAVSQAEPREAALLGLGRNAGPAQHRGRQRGGDSEGRGAAHDLAPRNAALFDLVRPVLELTHWLPPLACVFCSSTTTIAYSTGASTF